MNGPAPPFLEDLRRAPERPGVYLFRDAAGRVLYVGKARNLRRRVQAYRRPGADGRARFADLLSRAVRAEFRVTDTEAEAILLEDRLAKLHQPPLNVLLKDDKSWLLVELDLRHPFPRLGLARQRGGGQGEVYGPFASAGAARRVKRLLQQAFRLRDCSDHTLAHRHRPCLQYDLRLCSAPCTGRISREDYAAAVAGARRVLAGEVDEQVAEEERRMAAAAARLEYESARRARDRIRALRALAEPQRVRLAADRDFDVLGLDVRGRFVVLEYRDGDWVHSRQGEVPLAGGPAEAVAEILPALYGRDSAPDDVPPEILVPALPEEAPALEAWLARRCGRRIRIHAPARGEKRALLRLAESNARALAGAAPRAPWPELAASLGALCGCPPPAVVDCIDASHLQGAERVAARVRFVEGRPERRAWRRYVVGGGKGNDDGAALAEVARRMLASAARDGLPDLLVVDGGRLQRDAVLRAFGDRPEAPAVVALAKARRGRGPVAAEERLFLPERREPLLLERGSPERLFLERVRDEAHRFAIAFHRRRRERLPLLLDQVPGIGPARRRRLLAAFGSDLRRLRDAPLDEVAAVPGIGPALAAAVQAHLRETLP